MLKTGKPLEAGKPPDAGASNQETGEEDGSPAKPKRFNDLAATLDVDVAELYVLEIAEAADGSPVTVQALKDHYAKRSDFSVEQLKWNEERSRQQSELVRGNAELRELLAAIPRDKLDAKVLEAVRTKVTESANRERARTLTVIPEWKAKETMEADLAGMAEWLQGFGFPTGYLQTVFDHRAMNMMRTAWKREQMVKAALEEIEKEPTAAPGKSKAGQGAPKKPTTSTQGRTGRAGLEALLNR